MIKRRMLWWLLMLLLLVSLVWLVSNNEGYVLIVRTPYRVQISFNFLLLVFVMCFLGLHYSLRLVHFLRWLPLKRRNKKETMRLKAANAALLEGMHALAEGDFEKAEASARLAQELIQNSDMEKLIQALADAKNRQGLLFK
jgi:HemY protein